MTLILLGIIAGMAMLGLLQALLILAFTDDIRNYSFDVDYFYVKVQNIFKINLFILIVTPIVYAILGLFLVPTLIIMILTWIIDMLLWSIHVKFTLRTSLSITLSKILC